MMILSQYHIFELDTINIYSVAQISLTYLHTSISKDISHLSALWTRISYMSASASIDFSHLFTFISKDIFHLSALWTRICYVSATASIDFSHLLTFQKRYLSFVCTLDKNLPHVCPCQHRFFSLINLSEKISLIWLHFGQESPTCLPQNSATW